jgi:glycerol kinase
VSVLVIDVGTTDLRAAVLRPDGSLDAVHEGTVPATTPLPGLSEFDPVAMAQTALGAARASLADGGPVSAVAVATQRASTVLWERRSGLPVGPGIGWQDLRTAGTCLALKEKGLHLMPNQSATKLKALLDMAHGTPAGDLCFGTVDSWLLWNLSERSLHVADATNAAVTGLVTTDAAGWDERVLDVLGIPAEVLPAIVDSSGVAGQATALAGAPPITGVVGDQQASLVGQGCVGPGQAKLTLGTGGMLDQCVGPERPRFERQGPCGTFPIVGWRLAGRVTWGVEATMLSAGSCMEWLRDDLGLISSAAECDQLAASCADSGGVRFVPALFGLGTPEWDYGARGLLLGVSRGAGRAQVARAVLDGIAQRSADLVEATVGDTGLDINVLRVDGGMSRSDLLMQLLADASGRRVEVSEVTEATTRGAGFLAGVAIGIWTDLGQAAEIVRPRAVLEPTGRSDREGWLEARKRALRTIPELSQVAF